MLAHFIGLVRNLFSPQAVSLRIVLERFAVVLGVFPASNLKPVRRRCQSGSAESTMFPFREMSAKV